MKKFHRYLAFGKQEEKEEVKEPLVVKNDPLPSEWLAKVNLKLQDLVEESIVSRHRMQVNRKLNCLSSNLGFLIKDHKLINSLFKDILPAFCSVK